MTTSAIATVTAAPESTTAHPIIECGTTAKPTLEEERNSKATTVNETLSKATKADEQIIKTSTAEVTTDYTTIEPKAAEVTAEVQPIKFHQ
ncbi:hypothetical protein RRG08_058906 [Elysia crispata]|uniref:Uncharacterized protein n=1 Tax=Elysia crispata TaxID=231223 RepID=A0AAE0ZDX4_9GAST|nr:hypothetical protein RRG08_058906 [Elysia crispata]